MDHVDECSCVGYAVSNFDLLSELWENSQIQISFKHYSFIVIIICFFSYKLLIRSTFCMNLMWYIFEGVVVSQWSSFHFFFLIWSSVSSLLLAKAVLKYLTFYHTLLFISLQMILNQTKCSLTNKSFDEQMCTQGKHMSLTVSIKFINGKIWVFTPL